MKKILKCLKVFVIILAIITSNFIVSGTSTAYADTVTATVTTDSSKVYMENGNVKVTFNKSNGRVTSLINKANSQEVMNSSGGYFYANYDGTEGSPSTVTSISTDSYTSSEGRHYVQTVFQYRSGPTPYYVDVYFVMLDDTPGVYSYSTYYLASGKSVSYEENRYCMRLTDDFDYFMIGDGANEKGTFPAKEKTSESYMFGDVQIHKYADSTLNVDNVFDWSSPTSHIYTKYEQAKYEEEQSVYGLYSNTKTTGFAIIKASTEDATGGPSKYELSVHQTSSGPIAIWHHNSGHAGRGGTIINGEWKKIYGPVLYYVSSAADSATFWTAAKNKLASERNSWASGYEWCTHEYFNATDGKRRDVSGVVTVDGSNLSNGWVVIAPANYTKYQWQFEAAKYTYSSKVTNGTYKVPGVRLGTYRVFAYGNEKRGEYQGDITVTSGSSAQTDNITYRSNKFDTDIFSIGTPNRTAKEFNSGTDYRQWGQLFKYGKDINGALTFTYGTDPVSKLYMYQTPKVCPGASTDYTPYGVTYNSSVAPWNIIFSVPSTINSIDTTTLRFGIAGDSNVKINVNVNSGKFTDIVEPRLTNPEGTLVNDSSMARISATGIYNEVEISIPASALNIGGTNNNTITLTAAATAGDSFAAVMYDYIAFGKY